jgi:hypothetical protein
MPKRDLAAANIDNGAIEGRARLEIEFEQPYLLGPLFGDYDRHLVMIEDRLGVHVAALPGAGAVAYKLDDGGDRGRMPTLSAGLQRLGVSAEVLAPWLLIPVLGGDDVVGEVRPAASVSV